MPFERVSPNQDVVIKRDRPEWGIWFLGAIVLLEFFLYPRWKLGMIHLRPVDFVVLLGGGCLAVELLRGGQVGLFFHVHRSILFWGGALLAVGMVSATFAFEKTKSWLNVLQLAEFLTMGVLGAKYAHNRRTAGTRSLLILIALLASIQSLVGLVQFVTDSGPHRMFGLVRISGTLGNSLASFLLLGWVLILGLHTTCDMARRKWAWGGAGLLFTALLLVQVRTIWIMSIPAAGLLWLLLPNKKRIIQGVAASVVLGVGLFLGCLALSQNAGSTDGGGGRQIERWGEVLLKRGTKTVSVRRELWAAAVRMGRDRPLTGVGLGNFGSHFLDHPYGSNELRVLSKNMKLGSELDAHSGLFTRVGELGFFGTGVFLSFYFFLGWRIWNLVRRSGKGLDPTWGTVAVVVLLSLIADLVGDPPGGKLFWVFAGLLIAVSDPPHRGALPLFSPEVGAK